MITKQAVQTSANVIRITSVTAGDVYKRFDDSYDERTYYGVVRAVHNDGENAIIEATEYCYKYSDLSVDHKIIRGSKDYIIFPSSPDELNLELDKAKRTQEKKIEEAKDEIDKSQKILKEIDGMMSGKTLKELKAMSYKELSQSQYESKKLELAA